MRWKKVMGTSTEIKNWIREVRKNKSISDSSILIQKEGALKTRITLLDNACCLPYISIEKKPEAIEMADIVAIQAFINHQH